MRKQLRSSDILYRAMGIEIPIKSIRKILIQKRMDVVTQHWVVNTYFDDDSNISERVRLSKEYFTKELGQYVKHVNYHLRKMLNERNSKA